MNDTISLDRSDLESKRKTLKEELAVIDWILKHGSDLATPQSQALLPLEERKLETLVMGELVQEILKKSKPKSMSAAEIHKEINRLGRSMELPTVHSHMSRLLKSKKYSIVKPEYGKYTVKSN